MAMGHKPDRNPFQKGIAFSTQCTAMADAVHCRGGCSALRERLQCTASEMGKTGIVIASPVLNKRKGRKKRNTQDTFLYAEGVLPVWDLKKRTKCWG